MKRTDSILLLTFGVIFWVAGTLYYQQRGHYIFENTDRRFWTSFTLTPILSTIICLGIFRLLHVAPRAWASAALLIALPGMFGEAILLTHFATWMPRLQLTSAGRYAAFLFAAYALFLTVAEAVTLRSTP